MPTANLNHLYYKIYIKLYNIILYKTKNVPKVNTEYPFPFVRCYQQKKANNKICKHNNSSTSFLNYGIGI